MSWEPNTEENETRKTRDNLEDLRQAQFFNTSSINSASITNSMGTSSNKSGFNFDVMGDIVEGITNSVNGTLGELYKILSGYVFITPDAGEANNTAVVNKIGNGTGNTVDKANLPQDGQLLTLRPQVGKSLTLKNNAKTNLSYNGNLLLGSDITLTESESITLRYQNEIKYADAVGGVSENIGGWIVHSSGNGITSSNVNVLKDPVKVASTGNNSLHPAWGATIDGIGMATGDRFLIKDQTTQADNGIYIWGTGALGISLRASDMSDGSVQKEGTMTYTQDGNTQAEILYAINIGGNNITIGTSANTWGEIGSGSGGGSGTIKSPCKYATTANITLSGEQSIDGTATSTSRVLVKNQTTASQNGIYVTATGAWARSTDMATASTIEGGTMVYVTDGTVNGDNLFGLTTEGTVIVGTTNQAWANLTVSGANTTLSNLALTTSINSDLTMQNGLSIANLERVAFNTRASSGIAGSISYNGTDIFAKGSGAEVNLTSGSTNWSDITIDVDKDMNQKQLTNLNAVVSTSNVTATGFIFNTSSGTKPKITSSANSTVMGFWVDGFESASVTYDTFGGNKDGEITVNGSSGIGARFRMYNSSTPSGGLTTAGRMYFDAKDSAGNADTFAVIEAGATNYTSGSEQGEIDFQVRRGGTNTESVAIINQTGFHPPINNSQNYNLGSASTPWNIVYAETFHAITTDTPAFIELYRDNTVLGDNEMGRIVWYGDRTGANKDSLAWIRTNILDYTQGDAYMGFDVAVNGLQDTFIELYGDDPKIRLHKPADLVRQAVPTNPASNATGKLFYNSVDNHLSFRKRNDANTAFETVDLEGGGASGANLTLSNLSSPTAINQTLLPNVAGGVIYSLGSNSAKWRNLFTEKLGFGITAMTMPTSVGTNGQVLTTDGSSTLSWSTASGGANNTLSNLGTTSLNASLNMNTNEITFDADADTSIYSTTDDELLFYTDGSLRLKMENSRFLFSNDITMLGNSGAGTENDINIGNNSITFTNTTQQITSLADGIKYIVPINDTHNFSVDGDTKLTISGTTITITDPISMNTVNKITNLATPTSDYDASTKKYVDDNAGSLYGIQDYEIPTQHESSQWDFVNYITNSKNGMAIGQTGGSVSLNVNWYVPVYIAKDVIVRELGFNSIAKTTGLANYRMALFSNRSGSSSTVNVSGDGQNYPYKKLVQGSAGYQGLGNSANILSVYQSIDAGLYWICLNITYTQSNISLPYIHYHSFDSANSAGYFRDDGSLYSDYITPICCYYASDSSIPSTADNDMNVLLSGEKAPALFIKCT